MKQNGFFAEVIQTDIIDVDESSHQLPPHKGAYKELKVADYYCPEEWSNDGVFIPVKEGDPLWFDFRGNDECAILCAVQRINPVTGKPADLEAGLSKDPAQNYLRMPEQMWLDGYAKDGKVYQFVVTKAGIGLAVNEFLLPKHMQDSHAIGFAFFGPKNPKPKPIYRSSPQFDSKVYCCSSFGNPVSKGIGNPVSKGMSFGSLGSGASWNDDFASSRCCLDSGDSGDSGLDYGYSSLHAVTCDAPFIGAVSSGEVEEIETIDILAAQEANLNELDKASMGAGGRIVQSIFTDDNTTDYYHEKRSALLTIYFALPAMYEAIMKKGRRQDASKKDKYKTSGHIGGIAVPLITGD